MKHYASLICFLEQSLQRILLDQSLQNFLNNLWKDLPHGCDMCLSRFKLLVQRTRRYCICGDCQISLIIVKEFGHVHVFCVIILSFYPTRLLLPIAFLVFFGLVLYYCYWFDEMFIGLNSCGFEQDLFFCCCAFSDSALSTVASKQQLPRTIHLLFF